MSSQEKAQRSGSPQIIICKRRVCFRDFSCVGRGLSHRPSDRHVVDGLNVADVGLFVTVSRFPVSDVRRGFYHRLWFVPVFLPSQTLNGSLTLELVNEKYWKVRKPLELYYAPTKEQQPAPAPPSPPPPPQREAWAERWAPQNLSRDLTERPNGRICLHQNCRNEDLGF